MLHGSRHHTLFVALLVSLAATLLLAPVSPAATGRFDASKARVITAKDVRAGIATFSLRGGAARTCRAARVRVGNRARRVSSRRVRAAVMGRRVMRVRLSPRQRRAAKRKKPQLVIYRAKKKPAPKQSAPATEPVLEQVEPTPAPAPEGTSSPSTGTSTSGSGDGGSTSTAPPAVAAGEKSTWRAPGSAVLSDEAAAALVRPSGPENRPANTTANHRVPSAGELAAFRSANQGLIYEPHKALVTGNFTGTTDEIIQWAAWKWGIDEDVFRAQAVQESWWKMSENGDGGLSFGIFQIKRTVHLGTHPLSVESTAFNADYTGALFRFYYDGHATWLEDVEHGKPYEIGDMWGAIGAHYAGRWWANGADNYVSLVQGHHTARTWESSSF